MKITIKIKHMVGSQISTCKFDSIEKLLSYHLDTIEKVEKSCGADQTQCDRARSKELELIVAKLIEDNLKWDSALSTLKTLFYRDHLNQNFTIVRD